MDSSTKRSETAKNRNDKAHPLKMFVYLCTTNPVMPNPQLRIDFFSGIRWSGQLCISRSRQRRVQGRSYQSGDNQSVANQGASRGNFDNMAFASERVARCLQGHTLDIIAPTRIRMTRALTPTNSGYLRHWS
jgi:hypothetical protein